jgi:hypothetical protein
MLGAHIIEAQFLAMWTIEYLEWKDFLAYNIVCYSTTNLEDMVLWNLR